MSQIAAGAVLRLGVAEVAGAEAAEASGVGTRASAGARAAPKIGPVSKNLAKATTQNAPSAGHAPGTPGSRTRVGNLPGDARGAGAENTTTSSNFDNSGSGNNSSNSSGGGGTGSGGKGGDDCTCVGPIIEQLGYITSILQLIELNTARKGGGDGGGGQEKKGPTWTDTIQERIRGAGTHGAEAIHNRYLPTLKAGIAGGTAVAGAIPGIGPVLGVIGKVVGEVTEALAKLVQAVDERAKQLIQYSGVLASTSAQINVKNLLADIREAQTLGPEMSRVQLQSNQIWIEIRDAVLPIKKWLLEKLNDLLEGVHEILTNVRDRAVEFYVFMNHLPDLIKQKLRPFGDPEKVWKDIRDDVAKIVKKMLSPDFDGKLWSWWVAIEEASAKQISPRPVRDQVKRGPGRIPAVGGGF